MIQKAIQSSYLYRKFHFNIRISKYSYTYLLFSASVFSCIRICFGNLSINLCQVNKLNE